MIRTFKPTGVHLYLNDKANPLLAWQVREKTGAKLVINAALFNEKTWLPCCDVKADGKVVSDDPYTYRGIGWKAGSGELHVTTDMSAYDNYISCVMLINAGVKLSLVQPNGTKVYTPDVGRSAGRTAVIGFDDGTTGSWCVKEGEHNMVPEELQDAIFSLGHVVWALMLDGGSSSQLSQAGDEYVYSSRPVECYLCFYWDETPREALVNIAAGEIGSKEPTGDDKYIKWYNGVTKAGLALTSSWCAMFVSWCCAQAGIPDTQVKPYCSCTTGMKWFKEHGTWHDRAGYTPKPGDLIFFNEDNNPANAEHTGIVRAVGSKVCTIEGNTSDAVGKREYSPNDEIILGYVEWDKTPAAWYEDARQRLMAAGITDGTNPDSPIARAEAWVMLDRAINK